MNRRMLGVGYNEDEYGLPHTDEHDWETGCEVSPKCTPVDPNHVSAYDPPPPHYDRGGIQPWDVWDAFDLDRYTANAVKYLLRAGKKDIAPRLDDLIKARNYINKAIEMEEEDQREPPE